MAVRSFYAALSLVLLPIGGCASDATKTEQLSVTPADARRAAAGIYVGTGRLDFTEQMLISRCMKAAGLEYAVVPQLPDRPLPSDYSDDITKARSSGYELAVAHTRAQQVIALDTAESQGERYQVTLLGPTDAEPVSVQSASGEVIEASSEGCYAQARKRLYGSVEEALRFSEFRLNTLRSVLYAARQRSDQVRTAFGNWHACMAEHGYPDLPDRNSARGLATTAYTDKTAAEARAFELRIAEVDATCDLESEYADIARPVEDRALARFITDHEAEVTAVQEIQEQAIVKAQDVLAP